MIFSTKELPLNHERASTVVIIGVSQTRTNAHYSKDKEHKIIATKLALNKTIKTTVSATVARWVQF